MEKRKRDRKTAPRGQQAGSPRSGPAGSGAGAVGGSVAGLRKAGMRGGPRTENEEQLLQIIEDLRNDLRLRDEEYED